MAKRATAGPLLQGCFQLRRSLAIRRGPPTAIRPAAPTRRRTAAATRWALRVHAGPARTPTRRAGNCPGGGVNPPPGRIPSRPCDLRAPRTSYRRACLAGVSCGHRPRIARGTFSRGSGVASDACSPSARDGRLGGILRGAAPGRKRSLSGPRPGPWAIFSGDGE